MNLKGASFRVPVGELRTIRRRLLAALPGGNAEDFSGMIRWRLNDTLAFGTSKVTIVAYASGSIVVSGHGTKFDLTASMLKGYDKSSRQKR